MAQPAVEPAARDSLLEEQSNLTFCCTDSVQLRLHAGGAAAAGLTGVFQGVRGNPRNLPQHFANFGLELPLTILDALDQIRLYAGAVHLQQVVIGPSRSSAP